MALNERLQRFLDAQGVRYQVLAHREVFTAQEVAAASDVSGRHVAKVLIARDETGSPVMVVLPAPCRVSLPAVQDAIGARKLSLASELEFEALFPDCDLGAMPPFGGLYGMPVYVDVCFSATKDFFFQAGNHHEIVRMRYEDFERLAKPVIGEFCAEKRAAA